MMNGTSSGQDNWRGVRRLRAWELRQKGVSRAEIAKVLDVSPGTVSRWFKRAKESGVDALIQSEAQGRKPNLNEEQQQRLLKLLANGAKQYGFWGDFWTRPRVCEVIWREFGISYAEGYVGQFLERIGWHLQPPNIRVLRRAEVFEQWQAELQVHMGNKRKQS